MQASSDSEKNEPSDALVTQVPLPKPSTPFATSLNVQIGLGFYGILLPIVCHLFTALGAPSSAAWQSGKFEDKMSFVLSGECAWPTFLLLTFSMVSMGKVILDETDAISNAWVRLGIFSGVFVCGWYVYAFSLTEMHNSFSLFGLLLGAAIWLLVVHGGIWLIQFLFNRYDPIFGWVAVSIGTMIIVLTGANGSGPFGAILLVLILSTPLAFLVYFWMSIRILMLHEPARRFTLSQLMAWVTWFSAYALALQKTIALSFAKYAELPLEAPENCYVATAASKGYPLIVGSQSLSTTTDQPMTVNQQLATFKAAELTLRAVSPQAHRMFRFVYNHLGPRAAAKLRGPVSATAAYLCLKPAEWLCRIVLRILLGHQTYKLSKELYRARAKQVAGLARVQDFWQNRKSSGSD